MSFIFLVANFSQDILVIDKTVDAVHARSGCQVMHSINHTPFSNTGGI